MGLSLIESDSRTSYLSAGIDHHTVVLQRGDAARCVALGFQLAPGTDLNEYSKQVAQQGVQVHHSHDSQPNIPGIVTFEDPKGTRIEIFADREPISRGPQWVGVAPNKLGHVAFNVTDIRRDVRFYCDVLGFKESDLMGDFFAFLRCGPDHHTINLVAGATPKMHHIAFELRDFTHIRDACDLLAVENIPLIWGALRHGIEHNIATYHRDPDGQIIELFCELDRVNEKSETFEPQRCHQEAANMWGSPPPEGYLD